MAASSEMKQVLAVFVLVVLALALTPSVASFATDAAYTEYTDFVNLDPSAGNSTVLSYEARNDSTTYAYFTITLNVTSEYGSTTIDCTSNITYTEATQTLEFNVDTDDSGPFDPAVAYGVTIVYYTNELTNGVVLVLVPIATLLWVVAVLAVGVTMITVLLKRGG
jgi:hypothetical protein